MNNAQGEKLVAIGCAMFTIAPLIAGGLGALGLGLYRLLSDNPGQESVGEALLGGVLFTLLGLGITGYFIYCSRDVNFQRQLRAEFPAEPWRWRKDWAAGIVHGKKPIEMFGSWVAMVLYGGTGIVFCVLYWDFLYDSPFAAALLLFPLVGIALLARALYLTARWRKYGSSTCELPNVPAAPGGVFQAQVRTRIQLEHEETVNAKLTCYHRYTYSGAGNRTKVRRDILWQESEIVPRERVSAASNDTVYIPISIPIASTCPPTTPDSPSDRIEWELSVRAAVSGINFEAAFIVPVF